MELSAEWVRESEGMYERKVMKRRKMDFHALFFLWIEIGFFFFYYFSNFLSFTPSKRSWERDTRNSRVFFLNNLLLSWRIIFSLIYHWVDHLFIEFTEFLCEFTLAVNFFPSQLISPKVKYRHGTSNKIIDRKKSNNWRSSAFKITFDCSQ